MMVDSTALAFRGTHLDTEMPRNATPEELAGLTAAVMVIVGADDPMFRPDRILPRSRELFVNLVATDTLTGCRHILSPTCAQALCDRIGPFLTGAAEPSL